MGLGKTIQTIAMMQHLHLHENVHGPFLVIAPLSTLPHWKACFENWTEMNSVYYHDSGFGVGANARDLIRRREWYTNRGEVKFEAMLTSFNIFTADLPEFANIKWRYVIVDEAHHAAADTYQRVLAGLADEVLDDGQGDVGLEQRHAHLAQHVLHIGFGDAGLAAHRLDGATQSFGEGGSHGVAGGA